MQFFISQNDLRYFSLAVLDFLDKRKIKDIHSLSIKSNSPTQATARVIDVKNNKPRTAVLHLEKLDDKKIKVTELALDQSLLKGTSCSLGPFVYQEPSFEPIVPLFPPFWGGGI